MSDYNRVILVGRVGNELELKTSNSGNHYLRLSVATHSYRGGEKKQTFWHRVIVFGAQAKLCVTYLEKGSPVLIEGSLEVNTYPDGEDENKKRTQVNVLADKVYFLGGRQTVDVTGDKTKARIGDSMPTGLLPASA